MKTLSTLVLVALLAACSSTPTINADYNTEHTFKSVKSYHIVNKDRPISDIVQGRIANGIEQAMIARGMEATQAEEADILIDFTVVVKDKTRISSFGSSHGFRHFGGFRRFGHFGRGFGRGFGGSSLHVRQYTEGSILVDLIDPAQQQTVWRGTATIPIKKQTPEERTAITNRYTEAIIQEMPLGVASINTTSTP